MILKKENERSLKTMETTIGKKEMLTTKQRRIRSSSWNLLDHLDPAEKRMWQRLSLAQKQKILQKVRKRTQRPLSSGQTFPENSAPVSIQTRSEKRAHNASRAFQKQLLSKKTADSRKHPKSLADTQTHPEGSAPKQTSPGIRTGSGPKNQRNTKKQTDTSYGARQGYTGSYQSYQKQIQASWQSSIPRGRFFQGASSSKGGTLSASTTAAVSLKEAAGSVKQLIQTQRQMIDDGISEKPIRKTAVFRAARIQTQVLIRKGLKKLYQAASNLLAAATGGTSKALEAAILGALIFAAGVIMILFVATAFLFSSSSTGSIARAQVSAEMEAYRPMVEEAAAEYGMEEYVELILAVMMQESGGRVPDVMQSSESGYNTRYPRKPQGITDPAYSIACGIQTLRDCLEQAGATGPTDLERIKLALQGYNYGPAYIRWALNRDGGYTKENAAAYSDLMCSRPGWHYSRYGDKEYVDHVLRYYVLESGNGDAIYPQTGMPIPVYYQNDYADVPLGSSNIARSGCGFTSCAMVASYLTGIAITPRDLAGWAQGYYIAGSGMSWALPAATAAHYGIGSVSQTIDPQQVLLALSRGKPVICSQAPGLFTRGGHIIVLRGITSDGRVYVNDPNKGNAVNKGYQNRAFQFLSEVHRTAKIYWIFEG